LLSSWAYCGNFSRILALLTRLQQLLWQGRSRPNASSVILFLDRSEADETIFPNNFRDFHTMPPHPMYCFASFSAGGPP
jgi:hypothetical protein